MRKHIMKAAVLGLLAGGAILGGVFQAQASDIRILPVDTAKFWSGARFDFDVEVSNAKNLQNVDVTINGVPAEKFFGKKAAVKDLGNGSHTACAPKTARPDNAQCGNGPSRH